MTITRLPSWYRWIGPGAILAAMAVGYVLGLNKHLSLQSLAENREALRAFTDGHFVAAILGFIVIYAAAVALSFPGATVLTITGGLLFGWLVGGLAAVCAATMGAMMVFQIAKSSFGNSLANRAGPYLTKLKDGFSADAFNYLLFLRLVPAFPFWLVNIAPALANVRLRTFAAATFIGIIPATFAFAFVGQGLDSIIEAQSLAHAACVAAKGAENCAYDLSLSNLITSELLLAFAALGVVALIPVAVRKWKSRK